VRSRWFAADTLSGTRCQRLYAPRVNGAELARRHRLAATLLRCVQSYLVSTLLRMFFEQFGQNRVHIHFELANFLTGLHPWALIEPRVQVERARAAPSSSTIETASSGALMASRESRRFVSTCNAFCR
jgi:hypothetical protein